MGPPTYLTALPPPDPSARRCVRTAQVGSEQHSTTFQTNKASGRGELWVTALNITQADVAAAGDKTTGYNSYSVVIDTLTMMDYNVQFLLMHLLNH